MAARRAAHSIKRYKQLHWGIGAARVVNVRDPDVPEIVEMGHLHLLIVKDGRETFELDFSKFRGKGLCHLAVALDKSQRLYLILGPAARADCKKKLWVKDAERYRLRDAAAFAPGRQNRYPYPDVEVQILGTCTHVDYYTNKKETPSTKGWGGDAVYRHKLGEESGKRPLLCVDRTGRLFFAGGNYSTPIAGITD